MRKADFLLCRLDHNIEKGGNKDKILLKEERFRILIVKRGNFWKELENAKEFIKEVKMAIDKKRER